MKNIELKNKIEGELEAKFPHLAFSVRVWGHDKCVDIKLSYTDALQYGNAVLDAVGYMANNVIIVNSFSSKEIA